MATEEGLDLNPLISMAGAEKLTILRNDSSIHKRAERASLSAALEVLRRAGANREPVEGDELPG